MNKTVTVRNLVLGEGQPKICVPLTSKTKEGLQAEAREARHHFMDLVEWRADRYESPDDSEKLLEAAAALRRELPDTPILFTCRTEDGGFSIEKERYEELNKKMIHSGLVDLVDVELFMGDEICRELAVYGAKYHVATIISNHDFSGTPPFEEMLRRLIMMHKLGADISKIAVMPKQYQDVLTLMRVTDVYRNLEMGPAIAMSMGAMGAVSRVCGECFGSAVTFATVGAASAPGQLSSEEVHTILEILHK